MASEDGSRPSQAFTVNALRSPEEPAGGVQRTLSPLETKVVPGTTATQVEPFHLSKVPVLTVSIRNEIVSASISAAFEADANAL